MFNSLQSALIPICVLAAIGGGALSRWRLKRRLAVLVAVLWGVGISCAWWWLPALLWPQGHTDPQGGWWLIAVPFWSLFASLAAVVTLAIAGRQFAHKSRDAA